MGESKRQRKAREHYARMSETSPKELVERLRGNSLQRSFPGCEESITMTEAADLIERLTAPLEGDVVERVARAITEHLPLPDLLTPYCIAEHGERKIAEMLDAERRKRTDAAIAALSQVSSDLSGLG